MIIAVDFDGTLQLADGSANIPLIQRLIAEQRRGAVVILWSCREGHRLMDAIKFCGQYGLRFSYVNQNAPETVRMLGHESRKICADIYIDDKAVTL